MGRINIGKVIAGGLVAGIVMNVLDFLINNYAMKSAYDAVMVAHNIWPGRMMVPKVMGTMIALDFAMAIVLVYVYAAIRPRFGAGPKTAVIAAIILSAATGILAAYFVAMGFFPKDLWIMGTIASTVNMIVSGLAGAAFYKE